MNDFIYMNDKDVVTFYKNEYGTEWRAAEKAGFVLSADDIRARMNGDLGYVPARKGILATIKAWIEVWNISVEMYENSKTMTIDEQRDWVQKVYIKAGV